MSVLTEGYTIPFLNKPLICKPVELTAYSPGSEGFAALLLEVESLVQKEAI